MKHSIFAVIVVATSACHRPPDDPVREYIRLAVALGERDSQSLDYYFGPPDWVADVKSHPPAFSTIAQEAQQLAGRVDQEFLRRQIRAVGARASMLAGRRLTFDEESAEFFDLQHLPETDEQQLEKTRRQIGNLLPGSGSLSKRYDAFERSLIIPEDHVQRVLESAVKECRARTRAHLDFPLGESIETQWVHDRPWSAFSLYQGGFHSRVQWNADLGLTVDRALQLACHETYPGHHVQVTLIDQNLVQVVKRLEFVVQPTFSPQSFLSEALASYAVDLVFAPEEREQFQRSVLYPLAGINPANATREYRIARLMEQLELVEVGIARDFLDGRLEFARASEQLEQKALMVHAEETLKYLNQYRSYMLGYTVGHAMARSCFSHSSNQWRLLRQLLLQERFLSSCSTEITANRQIL
jgi:hypothetical protein